MFRASRDRRDSPDPFLDFKILLLVAGIASAMIGILRNDRRFIDGAIIIVAIGILLRFAGRRRKARAEADNHEAPETPE